MRMRKNAMDGSALTVTAGTSSQRIRIRALTRIFTPELVDFVVEEAGAGEERTNILPASLMVYFVLTMWLFTGYGYGLVLRELTESGLRPCGERRLAGTGSLTAARARLGQAPLRLLFDRITGASGTPATPGVFWRGLRLASLDDTLLEVPDSEANAAAYGRSSNGPQPGSYPQVRLLALAECGTGSMVGAVFDSGAVAERTLAERLLVHLTEGTLLMADCGPLDCDLFSAAARNGAHLVWRVPVSLALPLVRVLHDGSRLVELRCGGEQHGTVVRVVEYAVTTTALGVDGLVEETSEPIRLMTTLLEPHQAPTSELAELYAARWTGEAIFRSITIEQRGGRTATLRSNSPAMVEQELWAMLCVYQAVRDLGPDAAPHTGLGDGALPAAIRR